MVATAPGLAEIFQRDWESATRFYASHEITEAWFWIGVAAPEAASVGEVGSTESSYPEKGPHG